MKKLIATFVIVFSVFSNAFAIEVEQVCGNSNMLKHGGIAAVAGAGAALIIPGVGPVIATSILAGSVTTTANVAFCAYEDKIQEENRKNGFIEKSKKTYTEVSKKAEVIYKDLYNETQDKKDKATQFYHDTITALYWYKIGS